MRSLRMSPPTWGCGLKLVDSLILLVDDASPPTWGCGLKPRWCALPDERASSPPTWGCGLKLHPVDEEVIRLVTPHVGVWIETNLQVTEYHLILVTPHVGVWIETYSLP